MKQNRFWLLLIFLALLSSPNVDAQEELTAEELEILQYWDLLEDMEFFEEDVDFLENIDEMREGDNNE